jgi:hypothetical protein
MHCDTKLNPNPDPDLKLTKNRIRIRKAISDPQEQPNPIVIQFLPGIFRIEKLEQLEDKLLIDDFFPDGGLEVRGFKKSKEKLVYKLKKKFVKRKKNYNFDCSFSSSE